MAHWVLEDADGVTFDLSAFGNSVFKAALFLDNDSFTNRFQEIKKSYTDGSTVPGTSNIDSKILNFKFVITYPADDLFRNMVNELTYNLRKATNLLETDEGLRTSIKFKDMKLPYGKGGHKRIAEGSFSFLQLTPFWEGTTAIEDDGSGTDFALTMDNIGAIPSPPTILLTTAAITQEFTIYISETKDGMNVKDLQFGSVGVPNYTLDNVNGNIILGDLAGVAVTRNDRIKGGTGFFKVPVGEFNINFISLVSCDMEVSFFPRYYI